MKEELTAEMHYDFWSDKMTREQFMTIAVRGAMNKGESKTEACKRFGITEEFYDKNFPSIFKIISED